MITAIVFDLDGTLLDSVDAHALSWFKAFKYNNFHDVNVDDIKPLIGLPGIKIVEILLGKDGLKFYMDIVKAKEKFLLEVLNSNLVKPFPGVVDTLQKLREMGLKIGLATSTPSRILNKLFKVTGLSGNFFEAIVPGDYVTKGKPDPEIFIRAFEALKTEPSRGVIVGDTEYDILPAKAIGAKAILVLNGRELSNLKLKIEPDYIIDELPALINIIKKFRHDHEKL